ncbi:thioredoxin domain-containing protein [Shewanella submarina]|uniref:DsbA family protein n=1 Tax=Shewanella submarina TaxID=2016376 RepID=A0ABV7GEK7_9GAMM|nr:thioredoxin domain-containing protein [Shewanella submarina]MCL1038695.1 thioredoxin domain-containing protein [Shewanella submarina]
MAIPIPQRPSGVLLGDPSAQVTLDVFVDLQCPHSKKLWPTLMEVMNAYKGKSLGLKTHLITLSNHRQAWDMTLGLLAFADGNGDRFYQFATHLYAHQELFYNGQFRHKTQEDLIRLIAEQACSLEDINKAQFISRMADDDIYIAGRTPIRYAATRAVWATPTIFINNADDVPVNHSSSLAEWQAVLDALI